MNHISHTLKTFRLQFNQVRRFKIRELDKKLKIDRKLSKHVDNNRQDISPSVFHHQKEWRNNHRLGPQRHRHLSLHHRKDPETHPPLLHEV